MPASEYIQSRNYLLFPVYCAGHFLLQRTLHRIYPVLPQASGEVQDDKNYFPSYNAGFVIRKETLDKYPEIKPLIEKLNGLIDDETMTNLNYQVEVENKNPQDVARKFLEEKGLIK